MLLRLLPLLPALPTCWPPKLPLRPESGVRLRLRVGPAAGMDTAAALSRSATVAASSSGPAGAAASPHGVLAPLLHVGVLPALSPPSSLPSLLRALLPGQRTGPRPPGSSGSGVATAAAARCLHSAEPPAAASSLSLSLSSSSTGSMLASARAASAASTSTSGRWNFLLRSRGRGIDSCSEGGQESGACSREQAHSGAHLRQPLWLQLPQSAWAPPAPRPLT